MTNDTPSTTEQDRPGMAARIWRIAIRVLLTAILGIGLGILAYYGVPALYRQYVEPLRQNSEQLIELEQTVADAQAGARLQGEQLSSRLAQLEATLAAQTETLAELQAEADRLQSGSAQQEQRLDELESLAADVAQLRLDLDAASEQLETMQGAGAPVQRLGRQLQMIRAMELLTRARIWLNQSNLGLAGDEIMAAQQILDDLAAVSPAAEAAALAEIDSRLDLALAGLGRSPVVAAEDLEIAWELLLAATAPATE